LFSSPVSPLFAALRPWFTRLCALWVLALLAPGLAHAAPLTVTIDGARLQDGPLVLLVFDRADGFPREARALTREFLAEGAVAHRFDLPPGRYAVLAYHDENGNGELDRLFGMIPTEGWGLSNAPKVTGKPSFDAAAFELSDAPTAMTVKIAY
jgi:uncharacterized protein (DUF2141 family)